MNNNTLASFTDVLDDEISNSQPISWPSSIESETKLSAVNNINAGDSSTVVRPCKGTGQLGQFRSLEEIDPKYRDVFTYPYFNLVQSKVIDDALYSDKSIVVCAPTGSGKTVVFEMAIVQLLMELEDKNYTEDFKIIYMAPVKALCTERLTEWYPKFTKLGLLCIEVTGDTDVDFSHLQPYKIIITTPEKWDMLTRRWRDHRSLVEVIKLFLIDEVHILNDETRGPVLEAVVSRMKTIESSAQSVHRIEQLQNQIQGSAMTHKTAPSIRFVAVSATVSNPEDVAKWLGTSNKPAVFHKFGDECRPVKLNRIVEGYHCPEGTSIFKFDISLNYKLWPIIQKYHSGKPTLIFCNTRKSVALTAETLSRELTINFNAEQKAKLMAIASTIKNKKLQSLVMNGVGCHHAGLLYEERQNIERAFRNRDLPILITTTTLAMGVNLPAHLVIIKNTQQYVNGAFQEYSISTVLQMVGRAGRPQFDTEATAVIMTRLADKGRYQALVGGCEPLQSYLHKRLPENLNSEAALGTVGDVAQCVQWLRSTFLYVRAARDPKKYLGLPQNSPQHLISKKIEELCVKAMNGLASSGLITMDEASCIESTEAGRLMSVFYLDVETMKQLMKIEGTETLERLLTLICESHELSDMHLRMDERRCLNALNRNNAAATIRFPMKGKITSRQMKLNCIIQAVLGCLSIPDPSLNQEAMKIMRIADRVCKCLVSYVTRPDLISRQPEFYSAVLNSIILAKCIAAHLWENSPFVSKQLKGIGPTFSTLLATAGKVNFTLLEESHPRDLERIMNKSAPAGNVLRRQISLLPKYRLSMTPKDESTVIVKLDLLNQSLLSENMEQLTAGGTHKCYIVVGDSTNYLLLLASFRDTDLIRLFDGCITHEIKRRHSFEHKIFAHCISSTFVGVDVQSEYIFNDLHKFFGSSSTNNNENEIICNNTPKKQTCVTDMFKKRKRKNSTDSDKTQSKEKKKRENAIIQNFKYLKKTFETASKNVKVHMNLPTEKNMLTSTELVTIPDKDFIDGNEINDELNHKINKCTVADKDIDSDEFINNDEKIDNILTEIENEMSKRKVSSANTTVLYSSNVRSIANIRDPLLKHQKLSNTSNQLKRNVNQSFSNINQRKLLPGKSNYSFIDLIEKNLDQSDDVESKTVNLNRSSGFSDTIKSYITKFMQTTDKETKTDDPNVKLLLEEEDIDRKKYLNEVTNVATTINSYPNYEIKEILNGLNGTKDIESGCKRIVCMSPEKSHIDDSINIDINPVIIPQNNNALISVEHQISSNEIDPNTLYKVEETFHKQGDNSDNDKQPSDKLNIEPGTKINTLTSLQQELNICDYESNEKNDSNLSVKHLIKSNCNSINPAEIYVPAIESNILSMNPDCDTYFQDINCMDSLKIIPKAITGSETTHDNKRSIKLFNKYSDKKYMLQQAEVFINNTKGNVPSNCNLTFCDNRRLIHNSNDLMIIKGSDPAIISKSFHTNNNNYSKFIKNCSYSNDLSYGINKNTYVKNFSIATTKLDLQSRQMANRCINVIKEIKMDLNITEIVSITQPKQCDIREAEVINRNSMKEHENDNFTLMGYVNEQNCHEDIDNSTKFTSKNKVVEKEDTQKKTVHQGPNPNSSITENKTLHEGNDPKSEEMSYHNFIPQDSNAKITANIKDTTKLGNSISENFNGTKHLLEDQETTKNQPDIDNIRKSRNSVVKNILQKYNKLLGKDVTKSQPPAYPVRNQCLASVKPPMPKSKKPFKISNIKEQHASLPETLINCYEHNVEQYIPTAMNIANNKSILNKYTEPECYAPCYNVDSLEESALHSSLTALDLVPITNRIDLESDLHFNLDQSMFDPRTLLQCSVYADDEEIITPPPQFCDDNYKSVSPNYHDADELNTSDNYKQNDESHFGNSMHDDFNNTESIFEDQCITDLTPSREIETWTLDEEDYWQKREASLSPVKSFTVIRRNNDSKCFESPATKTMGLTRQVKLGQFKFTHKNKFKKWK